MMLIGRQSLGALNLYISARKLTLVRNVQHSDYSFDHRKKSQYAIYTVAEKIAAETIYLVRPG